MAGFVHADYLVNVAEFAEKRDLFFHFIAQLLLVAEICKLTAAAFLIDLA